MNFGGWLSFDDAPWAAPDVPGVLQARADVLHGYPRGKSAMIFYGRSGAEETLRGYVAAPSGAQALVRAGARGARWIRFGAAVHPEQHFQRLLARFVDRFGAPPAANVDDAEARLSDG